MSNKNRTDYASDVVMQESDVSGIVLNNSPVLINKTIKPVKPPKPPSDGFSCVGATAGIIAAVYVRTEDLEAESTLSDFYSNLTVDINGTSYSVVEETTQAVLNQYGVVDSVGPEALLSVDPSLTLVTPDNFTLVMALAFQSTVDSNLRFGFYLPESLTDTIRLLGVTGFNPTTTTTTTGTKVEACLKANLDGTPPDGGDDGGETTEVFLGFSLPTNPKAVLGEIASRINIDEYNLIPLEYLTYSKPDSLAYQITIDTDAVGKLIAEGDSKATHFEGYLSAYFPIEIVGMTEDLYFQLTQFNFAAIVDTRGYSRDDRSVERYSDTSNVNKYRIASVGGRFYMLRVVEVFYEGGETDLACSITRYSNDGIDAIKGIYPEYFRVFIRQTNTVIDGGEGTLFSPDFAMRLVAPTVSDIDSTNITVAREGESSFNTYITNLGGYGDLRAVLMAKVQGAPIRNIVMQNRSKEVKFELGPQVLSGDYIEVEVRRFDTEGSTSSSLEGTYRYPLTFDQVSTREVYIPYLILFPLNLNVIQPNTEYKLTASIKRGQLDQQVITVGDALVKSVRGRYSLVSSPNNKPIIFGYDKLFLRMHDKSSYVTGRTAVIHKVIPPNPENPQNVLYSLGTATRLAINGTTFMSSFSTVEGSPELASKLLTKNTADKTATFDIVDYRNPNFSTTNLMFLSLGPGFNADQFDLIAQRGADLDPDKRIYVIQGVDTTTGNVEILGAMGPNPMPAMGGPMISINKNNIDWTNIPTLPAEAYGWSSVIYGRPKIRLAASRWNDAGTVFTRIANAGSVVGDDHNADPLKYSIVTIYESPLANQVKRTLTVSPSNASLQALLVKYKLLGDVDNPNMKYMFKTFNTGNVLMAYPQGSGHVVYIFQRAGDEWTLRNILASTTLYPTIMYSRGDYYPDNSMVLEVPTMINLGQLMVSMTASPSDQIFLFMGEGVPEFKDEDSVVSVYYYSPMTRKIGVFNSKDV